MTTKAAFSPEEWKVVLEGPPTAGMIVITAAHGGMYRETIAMTKAYVEARGQHGESELLDEIVAAKPKMDHSRYHSAEELKASGLAFATRRRCWKAKRPPRSVMPTAASSSTSPTRSLPLTARAGRASALLRLRRYRRSQRRWARPVPDRGPAQDLAHLRPAHRCPWNPRLTPSGRPAGPR
jgi:hypothetical protein